MNKIRQQSGLDRVQPYSPGKPIEEVQREYGITEVVKLASNENPLGPSPCAQDALHEAIAHINLYPDMQSYYLGQALARHIHVDPAQVHVNSGGEGVILSICLAYLENDDEVVISKSSFPCYEMYTNLMRARPVMTPLKGYRIDLEAMANAITKRTKLIFVCNPNNPTATIVTKAEVDRFLSRVPENVLVVFDEAYYEFVDDPDYPQSLDYIRTKAPNIIVLRTLSKAYGMAGLRIGYAVGDPEILAPLNVAKPTFAVNILAQAAGIRALEDKAFLAQSVQSNRQNRKYLYGEFDRLGLEYALSQTNFILVKIGPRAKQAYETLLRHGVIVRPCGGYGLPEYLRVSIGTHEENARFVQELAAFLQTRPAEER